jgi:Uma2 family endonuclease
MSTLPQDASPPPQMPEWVPDLEALVTEDHRPLDRMFVEKQYRLLTRPLYACWTVASQGRTFLVLVNVGWFYQHKTPAVVPDCLLSLDVTCPEDLHTKSGHSYYQWEMGKSPDVIIEIVSDRLGGEDSWKRTLYARLGVRYYAILDPDAYLTDQPLRVMRLSGMDYEPIAPGMLPGVGLGLTLWQGSFEGHHDTWLRWCDAAGQVIPTGEESAAQERTRADEQSARADKESARADKAESRIRELEEALKRRKDQ